MGLGWGGGGEFLAFHMDDKGGLRIWYGNGGLNSNREGGGGDVRKEGSQRNYEKFKICGKFDMQLDGARRAGHGLSIYPTICVCVSIYQLHLLSIYPSALWSCTQQHTN